MTTLRLEIGTPSGGAFQIVLDPAEVEVGRSATCAVRLPYPSVSGRHLRLAPTPDGWQVTDLGSKNGTLLQGRPLPPRAAMPLPDGAVLQIADITIATSLTAESTEGFTLTETGTMLRKLVAESADDASAYLQTPAGDRIEVPDFASALRPSESAPFLLDRRGHGFWLTPLGPVTVDNQRVGTDGVALDDGSHIAADGDEWSFHDPLQGLVEQIDDDDRDAPMTQSHAPARPARPLDRALLAVGVTTAVLSVVALLVIFEVL